MATQIPGMIIPKPTLSLPLRYGLFQAAVGPLELPNAHGLLGGLKYTDAMCGIGVGYEIACAPDLDSKTASFDLGYETVLGQPFIVYTTMLCPPVGTTDAERRELLLQRLHSIEQSVVEEVFSEQSAGQLPGLANNANVTTVTGGGTTATEVLSELETAFYCTTRYGAPAYVHMPIAVFNELVLQHVLDFDGTRWRTPLGSVVSTGCYSGADPDGAAPADGTFWVYITGQTTVFRTPDSELITVPIEGALNRATNQVYSLVERGYVVTFECDPYAKAVTLWT